MKKLMSTNYSAGAFNVAMLLFRFFIGGMMVQIGYNKLIHFNSMLTGERAFHSMIGIGDKAELAMLVFAEFFCSVFLILGLFTRLATIPLIIAMSVAFFMAHHAVVFDNGSVQPSLIYLCGYIFLLLVGPGKISVDGLAGK